MSTGVPQGFILGPTLFSLQANDLRSASDFETRLFVDDTVLIVNDVCLSSVESKVNSEIKKIEKWLWNNKLTLNLSKTTFMIVSPTVAYAGFFNGGVSVTSHRDDVNILHYNYSSLEVLKCIVL